MLNRDLEVTLNTAFRSARSKRHGFMTVEHLLLSLVDNESARAALHANDSDLNELKSKLVGFIDSTTPTIPENDTEKETQPTVGFQRVLQRAVFHAQSSDRKEVSGANVLVAIFGEQESKAVEYLKDLGLARVDVVNYVTHGISNIEIEEAIEEAFGDEYDESFDYMSLLKLKEEELDVVRGELEKIKRERELTVLAHEVAKKELEIKIVDSEKTIENLKERISKYYGDTNDNNIVTSINFKPEHRQAGLSILSYFSEIVRQKYPDMNVSVSIKQEDTIVSLVIVTEDGGREIIEKTLDEYGMVVAGKISPHAFLSNPIHIAQLENKLEITKTEIRSLERLLGIQENTIGYLKDTIQQISSLNRDNQKTLSSVVNKLADNCSTDTMFDYLKSLEYKTAFTKDETCIVIDAVKEIAESNPSYVRELKQYCTGVSSSMVATIIMDTLKLMGL